MTTDVAFDVGADDDVAEKIGDQPVGLNRCAKSGSRRVRLDAEHRDILAELAPSILDELKKLEGQVKKDEEADAGGIRVSTAKLLD